MESVILTKPFFLETLLGAQSAIEVTAELVCPENTESVCKSVILLKIRGTEEPFETAIICQSKILFCQDFHTFPLMISSHHFGNNYYYLLVILLLSCPNLKCNIVICFFNPSSFSSLKKLYIIYDSLNMLNLVFLKLYSRLLHWAHV